MHRFHSCISAPQGWRCSQSSKKHGGPPANRSAFQASVAGVQIRLYSSDIPVALSAISIIIMYDSKEQGSAEGKNVLVF